MNYTNPCPGTLTGAPSHMLTFLVNTLFTSQCLLSTTDLFPSDYGLQLKDGAEFDFVIVGGGTAGSMVASRLSENPNWQILLLEAGSYPSTESEIPKIFPTLLKTAEDWNYETEPSTTSSFGLENQMSACPRGKVLGGSSTINGLVYLRGNRKDFDDWAKYGNTGWDYNSVVEHFKKFEDLQGNDDGHLGKGGDLKIIREESPQPIREILLKAYQEMGYGTYREEKPIGYTNAYNNIWEGRRFSSAKAFLAKAKHRNNMKVVLNAQVGKLLIQDLSVTGVEVRVNDNIFKIRSRKEVILSAGSINSPQILMNSGIGPKDHLERIGIPVVRNLKVGENLQDHLAFTGLFYKVADSSLLPKSHDDIIDELYQYFKHRKGPLAESPVETFILFANTKRKLEYPNLQIYYVPVYKNDIYGSIKFLKIALNMPEGVSRLLNDYTKKSHLMLLAPTLTYPKSVGKVLLRSLNPFEKPKIFTNYLSDRKDEDLLLLLEGIRLCQNVTRTQAFTTTKPKLLHVALPNCTQHEPDSDNYWKCAIRNTAGTVHHLVGTCKMGPKSDPNAVVDPRLRVHGMKGVRVVDASIMPKLISCNVNAAVIMIGEMGAAMIREDWNEEI